MRQPVTSAFSGLSGARSMLPTGAGGQILGAFPRTCRGFILRADRANTLTIWVGDIGVLAGATNGIPLGPNDAAVFIGCLNTTDIYAREPTGAGTQVLSFQLLI